MCSEGGDGVGCGATEASVVGSVCFLFVDIHWMERMNDIKVRVDETLLYVQVDLNIEAA